jgi:hypothetical protein
MMTEEREKEMRRQHEAWDRLRADQAKHQDLWNEYDEKRLSLIKERDNLAERNGEHVVELARLRTENEKLTEHKRLLFEENGNLLSEKERGLWDANHPIRLENRRLRERIATLRASLMYIQLHCDHNNSEESCVCKVDLERAAYEALAQDDEEEGK